MPLRQRYHRIPDAGASSEERFAMKAEEKPNRPEPNAGLCPNCRHSHLIESARGSVFMLCQLSATDPHFPKYPRLPVLSCKGYAPAAPR